MIIQNIKDLKERSHRTFAWDFLLSEGDSIKEKFLNLHEILSLVIGVYHTTLPVNVITNRAIASSLLTCTDINNWDIKFEKEGAITYFGKYTSDRKYHLYSNNELEEEILIANNIVSTIKIFNHAI